MFTQSWSEQDPLKSPRVMHSKTTPSDLTVVLANLIGKMDM